MSTLKDLFSENNFERNMRGKLKKLTPSIIDELGSKALKGNATAAKILLNKTISDVKEPTLQIDIKPIEDIHDVPRYMSDMMTALTDGRIAPSQFSKITSGLSAYLNIIQLVEIEDRIASIERLLEGDDEIS